MTSSIPSLPLNDGHSIPQIGLGTWPLDDAQVADAIVTAAELGYRHIDSATRYGNETGVGEGIRRSGVAREEFFVTTKLDGEFQGEDRAIAGLADALQRMELEYVDLLLIHWPKPWEDQFVSTWKTFEQLQSEDLVRSIGTSNFTPVHLERLAAEADIVPAVNQIQLSPAIVRADQRAYHEAHGIITESWSPFGGGDSALFGNPVLTAVGNRYGKTAAQVMCRWHVQHAFVVIPKSSNAERMAQNLDVFDFELTEADLAEIATLAGPGGVDSDHDGH